MAVEHVRHRALDNLLEFFAFRHLENHSHAGVSRHCGSWLNVRLSGDYMALSASAAQYDGNCVPEVALPTPLLQSTAKNLLRLRQSGWANSAVTK
jgi:hypothetical protein